MSKKSVMWIIEASHPAKRLVRRPARGRHRLRPSSFSSRLQIIGKIETTPGVCGGVPCVAGKRVPVWAIAQAWRLGMRTAEIVAAYPSLRAGDVRAALLYAHRHPREIRRQIRENEAA